MGSEGSASPMSPLMRNLLGAYCLLLISILPAPVNGETATATLFGKEFGLELEARLLLLIALVGALGASIHMATSFVLFAGKSELTTSWLWWYLLRPFIGAALGTILYLVIRGVMFSKQAIEWLRQVFDQMFRRLSDVEER